MNKKPLNLFAKIALPLIASMYLQPVMADSGPAIVEFHIVSGTGSGPWNTPDKPVVVTVGQTLRIFNDDTVVHFLHTSGAPCPHGTNPFNPGETYDCVISLPYNETDMGIYDHNYGPDAQFYVQANPATN